MTVADIVHISRGKVVCGDINSQENISYAFSSDLMSDVLTQDVNDLLLVTGLANLQTIRTAEMADIKFILVVRNKEITQEMLSLALDLDISIIQSSFSMYHVSGLLFQNGLKPIF